MGSKQVSCDKIPNAVRIYINMSASSDFVFQKVKKNEYDYSFLL